ncbi:MAG TPA: metal-sensitive transcriptional regulator [Candidatus Eremiobacteraceae bacterium]|nr:metal-sensitive transcriptional regulator [Candidatus Eremiobacteraceae bacterium]
MAHPYLKDKSALVSRLHKIEGQVRGLARMVESDENCIEILTQIASARSALESLGMVLLQDHIEGCVRDSMTTDAVQERVNELIATVNRFIKT